MNFQRFSGAMTQFNLLSCAVGILTGAHRAVTGRQDRTKFRLGSTAFRSVRSFFHLVRNFPVMHFPSPRAHLAAAVLLPTITSCQLYMLAIGRALAATDRDTPLDQAWTGHCAIVPWHRRPPPFNEHRRPWPLRNFLTCSLRRKILLSLWPLAYAPGRDETQ